jgi:hypothetical protein
MERIVVWDWFIVDLYLHGMMAQLCMNGVSKVECGTAIFLVQDFTLWSENVERVRTCADVGAIQDTMSLVELVRRLL